MVGVATVARDQPSWTSSSAFKILLAEADDEHAKKLSKIFTIEGFSVVVARDGREAIELFDSMRPGVVLADVALPRLSGMDLCRHIRMTSSVPVIFLSARFSEMDVVLGFEMGADDYVAKPFRVRELVARVRAAHRRELERRGPDQVVATGVYEYGDLRMDLAKHEVTVNGAAVILARKEFKVLSILLTNPGRAISRETLISSVWGSDYYGDTKTLDVHVKRIRRKIEAGGRGDSSHPDYQRTRLSVQADTRRIAV